DHRRDALQDRRGCRTDSIHRPDIDVLAGAELHLLIVARRHRAGDLDVRVELLALAAHPAEAGSEGEWIRRRWHASRGAGDRDAEAEKQALTPGGPADDGKVLLLVQGGATGIVGIDLPVSVVVDPVQARVARTALHGGHVGTPGRRIAA